MRSVRHPPPLIRLAGFGLLYFVVLMLIAPARFYPPAFRFVANRCLGSFGAHRIAKYEPYADPTGMRDTQVSVGSDASGVPVWPSSLAINTVREGYAPAAVLVALVLASPISWRERAWSMAIGLAVIHLFVAVRVVTAVLYGFSRVVVGGRRLLEVGDLGSRVLHRADQIVAGDLHFTYIAPAIVWLLVTCRFDGVRALWSRAEKTPQSRSRSAMSSSAKPR